MPGGKKPRRRKDGIDADRGQCKRAPPHILMYPQTAATANVKTGKGKSCGKTQPRSKRTDREPSSARSASDRGTGVGLAGASYRVGGCCEPRTARGPL